MNLEILCGNKIKYGNHIHDKDSFKDWIDEECKRVMQKNGTKKIK